ncbi:O-antigen ligase family protein [Flavobacterium qiangtangense]|uniref:O-antigen ligase family protein n=1 Tax=Flavobacterium qiangtangense TaxID=1442595 RepID=UPI0036D2EFD9
MEAIRSLSRDNFLELFAIFFLIYFRKFQGYLLFEKKIIHRLILGLLLLSCILYFSRTMLIVAFILYASVNGYTRLTVKSIKIIGVFLLCVGLMYAYLFSIKIDRRAEGLENFLFKIKNAPEELFVTKINRNDHKDLWDHWRGYEAKRALELMKKQPSSYVVGTGQGSLVNLKFKAPLTSDGSKGLKYISELHNGYIYIFYKTGIIGLVILLSFLFSIYNTINKKEWKNKMDAVFISAIGIIFLFSTLTITGIYNSRDIIIFILGALLFFLHKENVDLKIKDEAN